MLKNQASQPALQALYQVAGWIATMPEVGACESMTGAGDDATVWATTTAPQPSSVSRSEE